MNPWQSLRSEISGAVRSIKYDAAARKVRRRMNEDTMLLPVINASTGSGRRRVVLAVGAILVPVAGFSGYLATADSLGALFPNGGPPAGLPEVSVRPAGTSPSPIVSPDRAFPRQRLLPAATGPGAPAHRTTGPPRPVPTGAPPVPTPAPTCGCATPAPSPTPTPAPSAKPSPSPTLSPTSNPPATSSATP